MNRNVSQKFEACRIFPVFLFIAFFLCSIRHSSAAERVALVIGCDDYQNTRKLENARADAGAVSSLLRKVDFEVIELLDPDVEGFYEGLEKFKEAANGAEMGLFYFAGHGIEVDGKNFLIPTDATLDSSAQLRTQAINLETVLSDMRVPGLSAKMLILDCCRDNPLSRSWMRTRSASSGLALIKDSQIPPSTMLMFAAAPGQPAMDGEGKHSPFTEALLTNLAKPQVSAFDAFLSVSDAVAATTGERQVPWIKFDGAGRAFRYFKLNGKESALSAPVPMPNAAKDDGLLVPGVRFGLLEIGSSPLEVSRILGQPKEAKSYKNGLSIVYKYPEKGLTLKFIHEKLDLIFIFSGIHTERGWAGDKDIEVYQGDVIHAKGRLSLDSGFDEGYAMFGEPQSGKFPDDEEDGYGQLSYDGLSFYYQTDGSLLYITLGATEKTEMKWWQEHLLSSPERAEQSRKLSVLFDIDGLKPGDTFAKVIEKWGRPDTGTVEEESLTYYSGKDYQCCRLYGVDRILRGFEPGVFKEVSQIHIYSQEAVDALATKGEAGKWISFFGKDRTEIEEELGNPSSSDRGWLVYYFYDGKSFGEVTFQCYDFRDSKCSEIVIRWNHTSTI